MHFGPEDDAGVNPANLIDHNKPVAAPWGFPGVGNQGHLAVAESGRVQACSQHPDAPHGFNRNASLNEDRYVCDCEGWKPPTPQDAAPAVAVEAVASIYKRLYGSTIQVTAGHHAKHYDLSNGWLCLQYNTDSEALSAHKALRDLSVMAHKYLDTAPAGQGMDAKDASPGENSFHSAGSECDRVQAQGPTDSERALRRLLCLIFSHGLAYTDDGELSDSRRHPSIDFLRDAPADIEAKIRQRNADTLVAPVQTVLREHSGCGSNTQVDSLTVRLNPGDKVVLLKGWMTQSFDRADAILATKQAPAGDGRVG